MRYWEMIRKDKPYPQIIYFNSSVVEELWPYCFRVGVKKHKKTTYTYEYMGEQIASLYGSDMTGITIDYGLTQLPGAIVNRKLAEVFEYGSPALDEGHFVTEKQGLIKYRACYLPFGNSKNGITHIIVGLSYRRF